MDRDNFALTNSVVDIQICAKLLIMANCAGLLQLSICHYCHGAPLVHEEIGKKEAGRPKKDIIPRETGDVPATAD